MKLSTMFEFAFLCMPKCASTSIEYVIDRYCNVSFSKHPGFKHMSYRKYDEYVRPFVFEVVPNKKIETFCLVRNPVDWVHSWYRFRTREDLLNPAHPNHKNYTGNISFERFVDEWYFGDEKPYTRIGNQIDFVSSKDGVIGVDKIFPLDDMSRVEKFLERKLKSKIHILKKNTSPFAPEDISQNVVKKIEQKLKSDVDLYKKVKAGEYDE